MGVGPLALAPPPAKAGGGWEGVPTFRADPKGTPPRPSPAFAGEGARARGFRRSYKNRWRAIGPPSRSCGDAGLRPRGLQRIALQSRSEKHTSELQSLMRISYAVFCLQKKKHNTKLI